MKLRYTISIFLIICYCSYSYSQLSTLTFKHLTFKQGLSNSKINVIYKDSQGYVWFGTEDGLNKFDGYDITTYRYNPNDSNSLATNQINCLFENSKKQLIVGDSRRMSIYDRRFDNFRPIYIKDTLGNIIGGKVRSIVEDKNGNYWLALGYKGLIWLDRNFRTLKMYSYAKDLNNIHKCYLDRKGRIIVFFNSYGLFEFDKNTQKFRNIYKNPDVSDYQNCVSTSFVDNNDNYWIGLNNGKVSKISIQKNDTLIEHFFQATGNRVSCISQDKEGNIWVATENEGIFNLSKNGIEFKNYKKNELQNTSLSDNVVYDIYFDDQSIIWLGTSRYGIDYAGLKAKIFNQESDLSKLLKSLEGKSILSVLEDSKGNVWVGTDGYGLYFYSKNDYSVKVFKNVISQPNSISGDAILSIFEDSKGTIWCSSYMKGFSRYNPINNSFVNYSLVTKKYIGRSNNHIRAFFEDENNNFWIVTCGSGLFLFDRMKGTIEKNLTTDNGLVNNSCNYVYKDSKKGYWIATYDGISIFDPVKSTFKNYKNKSGDKTSLSHDWVFSFHEISNGLFCIGTAGGLDIFDPKNDNFISHQIDNTLTTNVINGILSDNMGNAWISTNKGVERYNFKNGKFTLFDNLEGVVNHSFNSGVHCKGKSGRLYFGGINGLDVLNPDSIIENKQIPKVIFTDFFMFNESLRPFINTILDSSINEKQKITLAYKQSVFSLKFAALNYFNSEKNQYAYKMEGFDEHWTYSGNRRSATYTNLNPGQYFFRVKASNNDGVWNETGTAIQINILPPWWLTWWFKVSVFFAISLTLYLFYSYRVRYIEKQKVVLEQNVLERTKELSDANVELEEKQEEIFQQNEELESQKSTLLQQKEQILEQNQEIEQHRNYLEQLVVERTKELEKALVKAEESDRLKSSFLSNMSHEIRTPLNAIVGFSHLLADSSTSNESKAKFVEIIDRNTKSLLKLINDIIDISKIEAGELSIFKSEFDLNSLMNDLKSIYERFATENRKDQISIQLICNGKLLGKDDKLFITTDKNRLQQILMNLLDNALKYTEKGSIEFGYNFLNNAERNLQFYVRDTGIGISDEMQKALFLHFRKDEVDKTKLFRGVGLGLSISYKLAELLAGTLSVESKVHFGSTFKLIIPFMQNHSQIIQENIDKEKIIFPDWSEYSFLVAEDEDDNYYVLESLLKKTQVKIFRARDGVEVCEMFEKIKPDLILMDVRMPIMDGVATMKKIRLQDSKIPIIAQTAYAQNSERNALIEAGFVDYISKPYIINELIGVMQKFLK